MAGRWRSIRRMSGRNPMSSIRSASSSTRYSRPRELRVRLPEMIEQPARRRDDHVHAAAERMLLRAHADAAEDGRAGDRAYAPRGRSRSSRICAASSRVGVSTSARVVPRGLIDQLVQDREAGRRRSCRCRSWRSARMSRPSRAGGMAVGLDRSGTGEAELLDPLEEAGVKLEAAERHGNSFMWDGAGGRIVRRRACAGV